MELNTWWSSDRRQRYWMEITDRADLGANLHAPQTDGSGKDHWSYTLVTAVRPGDVVLHWHKTLLGRPGIVGYSVAAADPVTDQIVWNAHGTYGRARAGTPRRPAWRVDLADFTRIDPPVWQDDIRAVETIIRRALSDLQSRHTGPLYLPFVFSDKRPVRTTQGYLVTFPYELLDLIGGLHAVSPAPDRPAETWRPSGDGASSPVAKSARAGAAGYVQDVRVRLALEAHAVEWAMRSYHAKGFDVQNVGTTCAYDILAVRGTEELHIEVKGSSIEEVTAVELTRGEVEHGRARTTDLVVVDAIRWERLPSGEVRTEGGRARVWRAWTPKPDSLEATRYRHFIPGGPDENHPVT
jgi:Domain of unknown function (DUF3883)